MVYDFKVLNNAHEINKAVESEMLRAEEKKKVTPLDKIKKVPV
jgi:hypothetical protein